MKFAKAFHFLLEMLDAYEHAPLTAVNRYPHRIPGIEVNMGETLGRSRNVVSPAACMHIGAELYTAAPDACSMPRILGMPESVMIILCLPSGSEVYVVWCTPHGCLSI